MSARQTSLDRLIETWARWTESGQIQGEGLTMLARWMDCKGDMIYGGSSGSKLPIDLLEQLIEEAILRMAIASPDRADVVRLEFGAGIRQLCERRQIRGYDPRGANQARNADALSMSLRTYRRRLSEAKELIGKALNRKVTAKS